MSEVKFACPICGQHMTAESGAAGAQVECPSCFRKIFIPTTSGQTNLLVSAAQVGKPRASFSESSATKQSKKRSRLVETLVSILVLLLLAAAAAGTAYWYQRKVKQTLPLIRSGGVPVVATRAWTLDPEKGLFPEGDVAGSFQGRNFRCDRASLRGTTLTFRQGKTRPSDMSVSIVLLQPPAAAPTVSTKPGAAGAIPRIILRWRDKETGQQSARFNQGYLLNVAFEPAANERVRGKLYLAVPDEFHTYFAGHFDAEILEPRPPIPVEAEK